MDKAALVKEKKTVKMSERRILEQRNKEFLVEMIGLAWKLR